MSSKVVVTGASGFVGGALISRLLLDGKFQTVAAARDMGSVAGRCSGVNFDLSVPGVLPSLDDVRVVIHAAARVHIMDETAMDALSMFRSLNVDGTLRLARHAADSGVARFIFISSIKVNGECTAPGKPFTADSVPAPVDPYGISKYEAEEGLKKLSLETGMEVVIIRPPLVYGPGVKANFLSMMRWLGKGLPLPLGALENKRSLVAIGNLIDLIVTCIEHPAAANETFLVSDGEDLSTTQLLRHLARAMGKRALLIPVSQKLLINAAGIVGRQAIAQRICGSLQVNIEKNLEVLGWRPPVNVDQAMLQTACYYLDEQTK